jgi:hypothetical protein
VLRRLLERLVRVSGLDQVIGGNPFERRTHVHLPDPFLAEVLLDGVVVGFLTDRRQVDMFWFSYALDPIDAAATHDDLWDQCRFAFRDPATGRLCTTAFVGGIRPFVRDRRVKIRAMYFAR